MHRQSGTGTSDANLVSKYCKSCVLVLTYFTVFVNHGPALQVRWRRAAARVHARLLLRMVGGVETRASHADSSGSSDSSSSSCENDCNSDDGSDRSCTSDCSADAEADSMLFHGAFLADAMASPLTATLHGM